MRTRLSDWRDELAGEVVLFVGAAHTDVEYEELPARYNYVVLVNRAITIAPLFRHPMHRVFTFTLHMEHFDGWPEFGSRQVLPVVKESDVKRLPTRAQSRAILYDPVNDSEWDRYAARLIDDPAIRDRDVIDQTNQLYSHCNTSLLALHFLYHAGVEELHAVGTHDIVNRGRGGAGHYDRRLRSCNDFPHNIKGEWYENAFETFCGSMGLGVAQYREIDG